MSNGSAAVSGRVTNVAVVTGMCHHPGCTCTWFVYPSSGENDRCANPNCGHSDGVHY